MAARTSMADLILTLRGLTNASASDTTIEGVTYWTDEHLQDALDKHKNFFTVQLTAVPHMVDGSYVYRRYALPRTVGPYLESPVVRTLTGYVISTSDYTLDTEAGLLTFTADATAGYTLEGYTYNMNLAAADVWETKAAHRAHLVDIKSGPHQLWNDQEWQHCKAQAMVYRKKRGIKYVKLRMTDYA